MDIADNTDDRHPRTAVVMQTDLDVLPDRIVAPELLAC
jgi:hypothetical protein